jgi:4-hydroxy 2-oxovalerate aldolase
MTRVKPTLVDCTLRDGGYYNRWDFANDLIEEYLQAMSIAAVDFVELGFRHLETDGFQGGCAYTTDQFIRGLSIPPNLAVGVMVNAGDLQSYELGPTAAIESLFAPAADSPVQLVRIASHFHEVGVAFEACAKLQELGYLVGINLMQVADRSDDEISYVGEQASVVGPDVLYFADSLGSMDSAQATKVIRVLRSRWSGPIGIHAHDNMGLALMNTLHALEEGVTWVDATVTGMGRGAGNTKVEYLLIELADRYQVPLNIIPLVSLIERRFRPMQAEFGWGSNTFYYLAGRYGIHPTYVQAMLADSRYAEEDVLAVIDHLKFAGGKRFSVEALETGLNFYDSTPTGSWAPAALMEERDVLILGSGPGVERYRDALEEYVVLCAPLVMAFNTDSVLRDELVDLRVASHPFRLLSNVEAHLKFQQPLMTPLSMLPKSVRDSLADKEVFDFGLAVQPGVFEISDCHCVLPTSLTVAYAIAAAASGRANRIYLAGFDGYSNSDPRNAEVEDLLAGFSDTGGVPEILAITPSRFSVRAVSVFSLS